MFACAAEQTFIQAGAPSGLLCRSAVDVCRGGAASVGVGFARAAPCCPAILFPAIPAPSRRLDVLAAHGKEVMRRHRSQVGIPRDLVGSRYQTDPFQQGRVVGHYAVQIARLLAFRNPDYRVSIS
jgi:hypothetical protein